mmetsp:Transcript_41277/g.124872  ORF Transcript_41277/g.124872 Transcript_41277/m.124872 type:complete len:384 (+) Transcript_41277:381-1532(+)
MVHEIFTLPTSLLCDRPTPGTNRCPIFTLLLLRLIGHPLSLLPDSLLLHQGLHDFVNCHLSSIDLGSLPHNLTAPARALNSDFDAVGFLQLVDACATPPDDRWRAHSQLNHVANLAWSCLNVPAEGLGKHGLGFGHSVRGADHGKLSIAPNEGADVDEGTRPILNLAEVGPPLPEDSTDLGLFNFDDLAPVERNKVVDHGAGLGNSFSRSGEVEHRPTLVNVKLGPRLVLEAADLGIVLTIDAHDHGSAAEVERILSLTEHGVSAHHDGPLDGLLSRSHNGDGSGTNISINLNACGILNALDGLAPPPDDCLDTLTALDVVTLESFRERGCLPALLFGGVDQCGDLLVREGDLVLRARDLDDGLGGGVGNSPVDVDLGSGDGL